jgi:hypothetical protein
MSKNLWFKKKTYGWGWTPCTWQGWSVIGIYLVVLYSTVLVARSESIPLSSTQLTIALLIESALLIAISYAKGEKPSWSWGGS